MNIAQTSRVADIPGQKLRAGPRNLGKSGFGCAHPWPERADVHDPRGVKQKRRAEQLRADFSFPKDDEKLDPGLELTEKNSLSISSFMCLDDRASADDCFIALMARLLCNYLAAAVLEAFGG